MKRLLFVWLVIGSCSAFAQLQNLDFEHWYTDSSGNPKLYYWQHYTSTSLVADGHQAGTVQDANAYSGNYALTLSRWNGTVYDQIVQSAPTSQRIQGVTGYYKYEDGVLTYSLQGGTQIQDSAIAIIAVTHWNQTTLSRDTIGQGMSYLTLKPYYIPFSISVNYTSNAQPDSVFLNFCPTIHKGNSPICVGGTFCSFLSVDDLSVLPAGVATITVNSSVMVSPNPAVDIIRIITENGSPRSALTLCDMAGRVIMRTTLASTVTELSVAQLPAGTYIGTVANEQYFHSFKLLKQ